MALLQTPNANGFHNDETEQVFRRVTTGVTQSIEFAVWYNKQFEELTPGYLNVADIVPDECIDDSDTLFESICNGELTALEFDVWLTDLQDEAVEYIESAAVAVAESTLRTRIKSAHIALHMDAADAEQFATIIVANNFAEENITKLESIIDRWLRQNTKCR